MITSSAPGLGFSLTSLARDVRSVATNPNVQRAAVAAGQAYAPNQYAQATYWADRARGVIAPPGTANVPIGPPPGAVVDDGSGGGGGPVIEHPNKIQKNNFMPFIVIGGGALILLMLLKR